MSDSIATWWLMLKNTPFSNELLNLCIIVNVPAEWNMHFFLLKGRLKTCLWICFYFCRNWHALLTELRSCYCYVFRLVKFFFFFSHYNILVSVMKTFHLLLWQVFFMIFDYGSLLKICKFCIHKTGATMQNLAALTSKFKISL